MLQAIEMETIIPEDGKLPDDFRAAFGQKARIIVLISEPAQSAATTDKPSGIMALSGKIKAFQGITDPVSWQQTQRDTWEEHF